jgi:hypothetical protein
MIVSLRETEADAEANEATPSYVGQMSMMSSFLYEPLAPETYEVNVRVWPPSGGVAVLGCSLVYFHEQHEEGGR